MGHDIAERRVARLMDDRQSLLWLYRRLIELRRREPCLHRGAYQAMRSRNDILMYLRSHADETIFVALNIAHELRRFACHRTGTRLLCTYLDDHEPNFARETLLRPDEEIIVKLGS
jgi:alpha-glucosidase